MRCNFVNSWGRIRRYSAVINRFERDRVPASGRFMRWTVYANARTRTLIGRYVAAGSSASHGAGVAAADLVGGGEGDQAIVLRAASSTPRRSGANLAAGVKDMTIRTWSRLRKRVPADKRATDN
jgi:hypothetical protein